MSFIAVGVGVGALSAGTSLYLGLRQQNAAKKAAKDAQRMQTYEKDPLAEEQFNLARQLFNGRMSGAGAMERNIANSQASFTNNVNRNATSSGQALALAGAGQQLANDSYNDLAVKEANNRYNLLDNLNRGYQQMINENDKVYNSEQQKAAYDANNIQNLRNAAWQNIFNGIQGIGSTAMQGIQNYQQNKANGDYLNMLQRIYGLDDRSANPAQVKITGAPSWLNSYTDPGLLPPAQ
ncbi:hypothetical protein [Parafilimonas terrae]|uniref:Uncharacterized protein n=1 Tax=Parafilimonas terrae TaxID=1465490 RepID=A0A1I5UCW0_9BACT|nr:hypothetical protein [Parafilimonas terrae]SFP92446.1 hypothetical protein SAMN05444277_103178 [Parafilimonas terrae]